jgi:hypothetical protein
MYALSTAERRFCGCLRLLHKILRQVYFRSELICANGHCQGKRNQMGVGAQCYYKYTIV